MNEATLDILKYSFTAYILVKILSLLYIFTHNIIEIEQWSYMRIWSMYGVEEPDYFSLLVFAPVFETVLCCVIISILLAKFFADKWFFIILSASLFSVSHVLLISGTAYFTFIYTFFSGVLLAFLFWKYKEKYKTGIAFLITAISHSFYNLLASFA